MPQRSNTFYGCCWCVVGDGDVLFRRRIQGFETESALCFYDDEEEEMKVTYVVHELHENARRR